MTALDSECPCCGDAGHVVSASLKHGQIARCRNCGTYRVLPARSRWELQAVHEQDAYFAHPYFQARRLTTDVRRAERFDRILRTAFPDCVPANAALLDVGCDTGAFIGFARENYGMKVVGIDVSPLAIEQAKMLGLDARVENIATIHADPIYDLVVLNDVLEHVNEPFAVLANIASILRPNGRVYIATPNGDALIYALGRWLNYLPGTRVILEKLFVPYHEFHFSRSGLSQMIRAAGLTIIRHETLEFPMDEFGHGLLYKLAMYFMSVLQRAVGRPSLQVLVACKRQWE
jgi:2-polyprenyl-3-methyl-5-hydroxy-6-metoxy-1,4-benzoquinol methylase